MNGSLSITRSRLGHVLAGALVLGFWNVAATAANGGCTLGVQPILSEQQTKKAFQPLADYLGKVASKTCEVRTSPNFLAYWDQVRKGGVYDLVLDAAHFTDYRAQKQGWEILAKIPDTVSYSLIVSDQTAVIDAGELISKRIATLGVPSIGAARLNALFPNPSRQPITVEVESAEAGIALLRAGKVEAAILPTPFVSQQMAQGGGISVVLTTEPIPHIALSASPQLPAATRERLRQALLAADKTPEGREMLKAIGFEKFDPASSAIYAGQSKTLKDYWGF
jgi:ABC-type phosphate/phosphonate transport system substrate-binding protein